MKPDAESKARPWAGRPVLAVCGWSGSGKTTLLESVIPTLVGRGLRVAAVKHDAHRFEVDRPGKDSDRLYRAGADIVLHSPEEAVRRSRPAEQAAPAALVATLLEDHDLVLVEGHKETPLPKVWLRGPDRADVPGRVESILAVLAGGSDRPTQLLSILDDLLVEAHRTRPVWAGILIGGGSTRMGRPKHLLVTEGRTFLELVVEAVAPHVGWVVILGAGRLPPNCTDYARLPDVPGMAGPMAGMLSAMRWAPTVTWLFAACDMPRIGSDTLGWLLQQRAPGRWAVLAGRDRDRVEPLPGIYEPQARGMLEDLARQGLVAPSLLGQHPKVCRPQPPERLAQAWQNINTPRDLQERSTDSGPPLADGDG